MSHDISIRRNGFAEMAFVGETPWHKLGQRVDPDTPIETWQQAAGLDWQIKGSWVRYLDADRKVRKMDDRIVLYRSDTGDALSVVSNQYRPVQPTQILEFFRDLVGVGGYKIHTAGSLKGGRKIWAMASRGLEGEVVPGDRVKENLLLATACDGTMETVCKHVAERVVCANTLAVALREGGQQVKVSHRTKFNAETVKNEMGLADTLFEGWLAQARRLAETPVSDSQVKELLREIFGRPMKLTDTPAVTDKALLSGEEPSELAKLLVGAPSGCAEKDVKAIREVMALYDGKGRGIARGTAWGLLNAVTEYVDHGAGRSRDTGLESAWFGRGEAAKSAAFQALLTL